MSSYSDLYLYASGDETSVEKFNMKLAPVHRVYPLNDTDDGYDTNSLAMHYKYACRLRTDDVQDALNSVKWRFPERVVAIVLSHDYPEFVGTEVFRPYFTTGPICCGERQFTQVNYAVDPKAAVWAEAYAAGVEDQKLSEAIDPSIAPNRVNPYAQKGTQV